MKHLWLTWLLFGLCAFVLFCALGWVSAGMLQLEDAHRLTERSNRHEEEVRLALWRLDSRLAPLVACENARPYFMYAPFYPAERAYLNMFTPPDSGDLLVPSPLLIERQPQVRLYFQSVPGGGWSSPQVPPGTLRGLAERQLSLDSQITASEQVLAAFARLFTAPQLAALLPPADDRSDALPVYAAPNRPQDTQRPSAPSAPAGSAAAGGPVAATTQAAPLIAPAAGPSNLALNILPAQTPHEFVRNSQLEQNVRNSVDYQTRSGNLRTQIGLQKRMQNISTPEQLNTQELPPPAAPVAPVLPAAPAASRIPAKGDRPRDDAERPATTRGTPEAARISQTTRMSELVIPRTSSAPTSQNVDTALLHPLWVGNELLLLRRVRIGGAAYLQGCWLDWPMLQGELLNAIGGTLPGATLEPVPPGEAPPPDERRLAALPLRLNAPLPAGTQTPEWTPLRSTLALAWAGALLAALAVGALLRGALELSERRAMFVSAVTHELRTPLTTFRMYAEMLLAGMVPEARRQKYLTTLCAEAGRLEHLVENVLAYAGLEKRRNKSRRQELSLDALLERLAERLRVRAEQAGMQLVLPAPDGAGKNLWVRADPSAVEQILFNLVDNACKYAAAATDRRIHLEFIPATGKTAILVRDHGPGIPPTGRVRLFRPFAKSDVQAAESAPGVGLGLHLSRRLARAMEGELAFRAQPEGAAFVLTLPAIAARSSGGE